MLTVGQKTIKLQIWDTVVDMILRLGNSPSNRLREGTIVLQLAQYWFTI